MMCRVAMALLLGATLSSASADEPAHESFAYEAQIAIPETGGVNRLSLNADVYRALTRADLGDLQGEIDRVAAAAQLLFGVVAFDDAADLQAEGFA